MKAMWKTWFGLVSCVWVMGTMPWAVGGEGLPRVLLIGDSISIGYTPVVVAGLEGRAAVSRIPGNGQHTGTGLEKIDDWLGDGDWDVIHFNWGLWDICYRHPESRSQGNRDKVRGTQTTSPEDYEKRLEELVVRMKETGARLIWATTTLVPEGEDGRFVGDEVTYNAIAARVMEKHGVEVNDLHRLTAEMGAERFVKPGDVHLTKEGYLELGEQVVGAIEEALAERADGGERGGGG